METIDIAVRIDENGKFHYSSDHESVGSSGNVWVTRKNQGPCKIVFKRASGEAWDFQSIDIAHDFIGDVETRAMTDSLLYLHNKNSITNVGIKYTLHTSAGSDDPLIINRNDD